MKVIAIDVSKDTLDISFGESPQGLQYQKIKNDGHALKSFIEKNEFKSDEWTVVMESTGDYHRLAALFFLDNSFLVKIINPILTKQFTRATIRKSKTDKIDSENIWKLAVAGEGDEVSVDALNNSSKELLRVSHFLTKLKTKIKLKLQSVERKNLVEEDLKEELFTLIDQIQELIQKVDGKALEEQSEQRNLIDSIPGFSTKLSQIVLTECGDISRFENVKKFIAYSGFDPRNIQSGSSLNASGHITKRGPSFLRYALFLAARAAYRYDRELNEYYEKKRGEGRSFKEVMCMIARKLLTRIYTVIKEQRPYEIRP